MFEYFGIFCFGAVIVALCAALLKTKSGAVGCLIVFAIFLFALIRSCNEMQKEEEEKKEWNENFQKHIEKEKAIYDEYSKQLPENYRERRDFLESEEGKRFLEERDRALKNIK